MKCNEEAWKKSCNETDIYVDVIKITLTHNAMKQTFDTKKSCNEIDICKCKLTVGLNDLKGIFQP